MGFTMSAFRLEFAKWARALEEWRLGGMDQDLSLGAHLATSRLWYTHHGIYIGSGKVVHYAGFSQYWRSGPVEEVTLFNFVSGHPVWIVDHAESTYSAHEIIERARSRVGEHAYSLLTNNCEHFCNWCVSGVGRSAQIGRPLELSSRVIDLAASVVTGLHRMAAWRRKQPPRAECLS